MSREGEPVSIISFINYDDTRVTIIIAGAAFYLYFSRESVNLKII